MARLEGTPLPTTMEMARLFNVSQTTAFRHPHAYPSSNGMLKLVDRVRLPETACHCIVDLRTRLMDGDDLRRLEDQAGTTSPRLARGGGHRQAQLPDHLITRSTAGANAWFRAILTEPAVIDGALRGSAGPSSTPPLRQALVRRRGAGPGFGPGGRAPALERLGADLVEMVVDRELGDAQAHGDPFDRAPITNRPRSCMIDTAAFFSALDMRSTGTPALSRAAAMISSMSILDIGLGPGRGQGRQHRRDQGAQHVALDALDRASMSTFTQSAAAEPLRRRT